MADSRRQVSHSLRQTFTKLSTDSLSFTFFFSSFDETPTLDVEGLTETVLHLKLGFFVLLVFVFSPLIRK
jgi:hypothetical protein